MPFKKVSSGKNKGKAYTAAQVRAYYATKGFTRKKRKK